MRLLLAAVKTQPATRLGMAIVALAEQKIASKTPATESRGWPWSPSAAGAASKPLAGAGTARHRLGVRVFARARADGIQPRHCEIRIDAGRAMLRALDFRTWLNNGPVRQVEIHVGDRLTVGPLEVRVTAHAQVEGRFHHRSQRCRRNRRWSHTPPVVAGNVTAASERQREAESRLAGTESRLLRQADEIRSRLRSLMASEEGVAESGSSFTSRNWPWPDAARA